MLSLPGCPFLRKLPTFPGHLPSLPSTMPLVAPRPSPQVCLQQPPFSARHAGAITATFPRRATLISR